MYVGIDHRVVRGANKRERCERCEPGLVLGYLDGLFIVDVGEEERYAYHVLHTTIEREQLVPWAR